MSRPLGSSLVALFVSVMLAVASIAMGSMHGAVSLADARMEAFIAAGGDTSDICGDIDHEHKAAVTCVFCLYSGNCPIPEIARAVLFLPRSVAASFTATAENQTVRKVFDPARSLRGPPILV